MRRRDLAHGVRRRDARWRTAATWLLVAAGSVFAPTSGSATAGPSPWPAALATWGAEAVGDKKDQATGWPKRIRRTVDDAEMVLVPAGTFQMGAVPRDADGPADTMPRHAVKLSKAT